MDGCAIATIAGITTDGVATVAIATVILIAVVEHLAGRRHRLAADR